jgi:tight adherence protein C
VLRVLGLAGLGAGAATLALAMGGSGERIILAGVAGAALGSVGPWLFLLHRERRRRSAIACQLADVLDLLVVCVEAGLGLFEAIRMVGAECDRQHQAIGRELALVVGEITAGASLGQALRNLAERTAVEDLKPLAATLIQSEQLGAAIGPALQASADALRARRRLRAEEAAQKATVKILFPLVLFVLPAMLMVIVGPAILQIMRTVAR